MPYSAARLLSFGDQVCYQFRCDWLTATRFTVLTGIPLKEIAEYLGVKLGAAKVQHFSDGEISLIIDESVRGSDAYIIQPTCTPVNDNLMELLISQFWIGIACKQLQIS